MGKNVFEEMARRYDSEERIALAKVVVEAIEPELRDSLSKTLIDYGSGTGLVGLALAGLVDSVLLVDSSKQMLEVVEAKISSMGIGNADVLFSDFSQETPELKADIVLMSLVLLHVPDTKAVLQSVFDVLNEGGRLLVVDFDKNERVYHPKVHNGFLHEELAEVLSTVGFQDIEIRTFYHGERVFMHEDASMFLASGVKV